jgi:hypothetical protein
VQLFKRGSEFSNFKEGTVVQKEAVVVIPPQSFFSFFSCLYTSICNFAITPPQKQFVREALA